MSRPDILFLDEPSMGLAPCLVQEIFSIIKDINSAGTTFIGRAKCKYGAANSQPGLCFGNGSIVLSGAGSDLIQSDDIKKAYLGG